jgi:hypothetical protein
MVKSINHCDACNHITKTYNSKYPYAKDLFNHDVRVRNSHAHTQTSDKLHLSFIQTNC